MSGVWHIAKMFFDWTPHTLPADAREDNGFLLVVPQLHPEIVYLNEVAAFILGQCDGKLTVLDILKRYMVRNLRSDRSAAAWEVLKVLRMLERRLVVDFLPPAQDAPAGDR